MLVWGDVNADTSVHIDYQHQVPPKGQPKMPSGRYQDDKWVSISQTVLGSKVFAGADGFATNAIEGDDPFVEIAIESWVIYQRIWFVAWEQLPNQKAVLLKEVFFGYSIP
ncbi:MAG: hypothetical protein KF696_15495 [Planctomycetes bacterium]|nr:hypothetical protein [Planctomycetota bacterium]MCW8136630.1 hypothetical protein [Planctomycetota bacterium]